MSWAGLVGLSMRKVDVAFPRVELGHFGVGRWHKAPAVPQLCPKCGHRLGNTREGPEFAPQGGTLGIPQGKCGSFPGYSTEGSTSALLGFLLEQKSPHSSSQALV